MKSRVLLLSTILATATGIGAGIAQASPPDAQAQAAALLSGARIKTQEAARTTETTQKLGDHPAVIIARTWSTRGIDPNTFVVAHPARLDLLAASPTEQQDAQAADVHARLGR